MRWSSKCLILLVAFVVGAQVAYGAPRRVSITAEQATHLFVERGNRACLRIDGKLYLGKLRIMASGAKFVTAKSPRNLKERRAARKRTRACRTALKSPTVNPVRGVGCVADFDLDGRVSSNDISRFLAAWLTRDLRCDLDESGSINSQDISAFLTAYREGCDGPPPPPTATPTPTPTPTRTPTPTPTSPPEPDGDRWLRCSDGIDNDGDGRIDHDDIDCAINATEDDAPVAVGGVVGADGFTRFRPSADSRIIYVSSSTGNDANSGLSPSQAKRTISAGYGLLRNRYPDYLLLKRGDVFENQAIGSMSNGVTGTFQKSGRSATEMMVIGSYGPSPVRPKIRVGTQPAGIFLMNGDDSRDHLALVGISFEHNRRNPNDPSYNSGASMVPGISRYKDGVNFLVEDCEFRFFGNNINLQTGGAQGMQNVRIRRNIIADAYGRHDTNDHSQGIYTEHVHGLLIEENVLDHNGWNEQVSTARPTMFNHNIYIKQDVNSGVVIRGNISARGSATGIQCRPGGLVENNFTYYNASHISIGHSQSSTLSSGIIRDNVTIGARDRDEPLGRAINLEKVRDLTVERNIVAHAGNIVTPQENVAAIRLGLQHQNVNIFDNIVYKWARNGVGYGAYFGGSGGLGVSFHDNVVQMPAGGVAVRQDSSSAVSYGYANNRYFSSNSPGSWFERAGNTLNFSAWLNASGETGGVAGQVSFPDPNRTIESYLALVGIQGDFLDQARRQSRTNYRPALSAPAINSYFREGFGLE